MSFLSFYPKTSCIQYIELAIFVYILFRHLSYMECFKFQSKNLQQSWKSGAVATLHPADELNLRSFLNFENLTRHFTQLSLGKSTHNQSIKIIHHLRNVKSNSYYSTTRQN